MGSKKTCSGCKEPLNIYENRYVCSDECCVGYSLCETCKFSEIERHQHTLQRVDAKLRDYSYYTKESPKKGSRGAKLVLGSFASALPNSEAIKEENIKAVLSLLHFDTTKPPIDNTPLDTVHNLFFPNGKYQPLVRHNGILYYHINVPDLEDPKQLSTYGQKDLIPHSVLYIEFAMRLGNVLVHCEKGQRRSPTVFLAWLMYHGYSLFASIDMIAAEYEGDEDWGESYKRRRNLWIEGPLDSWPSKYKSACRKWISSHKSTVKAWKQGCFPVSSLKKRKREEYNKELKKDENIPPNKVQKLAE